MNEYLVFRLYGPMASWGEIAVGEVRRSASYPSRSAILGLISAALGIKREETGRLTALFSGYDVAVKVLSPGTLLKDYHTVQAPRSVGKMNYATRRDEIVIGRDLLGTMLTTREYRCDSLSIVTIRPRENAPYSLVKLQQKLNEPTYVLYLGRKSCPVSVPLKPQIISASGFREALDKASFPPLIVSNTGSDVANWYIPVFAPRYYWEGEAGDMQPQQTHERYDEPINRSRWQFAPRKEHTMVAEEEH
jgi:CRISPR system Cascade subunit CasD